MFVQNKESKWSRVRTTAALLITAVAISACQTVSESVPAAPRFISVEYAAALPDVARAGFDIDDTLLFSTPAFAIGFASPHEYGSEPFWTLVNNSDRGNSEIKSSTQTIVESYRQRGIAVYAITARAGHGGDGLRAFVSEALGIPETNIYFEPDGKTDRIRELRLDVYFGDSDSDMEDAMAAGARAVRIQRSPRSSYRNKDGSLRKYQPGRYAEAVVADSER